MYQAFKPRSRSAIPPNLTLGNPSSYVESRATITPEHRKSLFKSPCTIGVAAQTSRYGERHDYRKDRGRRPPAAGRGRRRTGGGRVVRPLPHATEADDPAAIGPPAPGPRRPVRRAPGR